MNWIKRKIRLFFTPGVCSKHELKKNYRVGYVPTSGDYYVCPDCMYAEVMSNLGGRSEAIFDQQRLTEFKSKLSNMRIPA